MPRKKDVSSATMKADFPTRLGKMIVERHTNQSKLATSVGIQRQTISNYVLGQSVPDGETLKKLADALDVSVDYLLARTDIESPDVSVQSAVEYTGLSEKAVMTLHRLSKESCEEDRRPLHFLNMALSDYVEILTRLDQYITADDVKRQPDAKINYSDIFSTKDPAEEYRIQSQIADINRNSVTVDSSEYMTEVIPITKLYKEYKIQSIRSLLDDLSKGDMKNGIDNT